MTEAHTELLSSPTPSESRILLVRTLPHPNEPPPPYPNSERRTRSGRRQAQRVPRQNQVSSQESDHEAVGGVTHARQFVAATGGAQQTFPTLSSEEDHEADENTPLLLPLPFHSRSVTRRQSGSTGVDRQARPRTPSRSSTLHSTISGSPSLVRTLFSAFQPDLDSDIDGDNDEFPAEQRPQPSTSHQHTPGFSIEPEEGVCPLEEEERDWRLRTHFVDWKTRLRKYFRPMGRRAYYSAVFHLLALNFPFALGAWIYLFVFTLTGTTLLMALPLGALLCFLDLLGARAFARAELALQSTFHGPLSYTPYPARAIFYRMRQPTLSEMELGAPVTPDRSFYRNAYAMFTDATSYQALFYFLVIKPSIALSFGLLLIVLAPVCFVLILPAPAMLRISRRLGIWQANVAVEGLYLAVR